MVKRLNNDDFHSFFPRTEETLRESFAPIESVTSEVFSLEDVDMDNPNDIETVGKLIYLTDPYVYPDFFDNDINLSIACAKSMLTRDTLFNRKNIKLGKINGASAGFMVLLEHFPKNNREEMILAMKESLGYLTPKFEEVNQGYFSTLDSPWEGTQIMSLAVLSEFRRKKVATKMLDSLPREVTYSLACVKDNMAGRRLYEKNGFSFRFEYLGYTDVPCVELVRKGRR